MTKRTAALLLATVVLAALVAVRRSGTQTPAATDRTAVAAPATKPVLNLPIAELHGRVVDTQGVLQPDLKVEVKSDGGRWQAWCDSHPNMFLSATTDEHGRFRLRTAALPIELTTPTRPLANGPVRVDLAALDARDEVEVVVIPAAAWPPISGDVVDETGTPVDGADIVDWYSSPIGTSDSRGRFELERPLGAKARTIALRARRDGYDESRKDAWFAWGQRDVHLVLRRGAPLRVHLLDVAGAVVAGARLSWRHEYEREALRFESGVHLGSATRGHSVLKIELAKDFDRRRGVAPAPLEFDVADATPIERTVRLSPAGERLVRVQRSDGVPCAGAQLEVVSAAGDPVTVLADVEVDAVTAEHAALRLLGTATTDARGEARVSGPADQPLALRVFGRHEPAVVMPFDLAAPAPLDVRVAAGARAAVRLVPAAVVDDLRLRMMDLAVGGDRGVRLHRLRDGVDEWWPAEQQAALPLSPAGVLEVDGAPPGAWEFGIENGQMGPPLLTLAAGDNGDVVWDLTAWTPGEIVGHARRNGVLQRDTDILVAGELGQRAAGEPPNWNASARTDAEGMFRVRVLPGRYSMTVVTHGSLGPGAAERLEVEVGAGQQVAHDFDELVGVLELTLVDEDGKPASGVRPCCVRAATDLLWVPMGPTDGDGVATGELAAGRWLVMVEPRSQRDAAFVGPRHQLLQRLRALREPIGEVTLRAGATTRATLLVPASLR